MVFYYKAARYGSRIAFRKRTTNTKRLSETTLLVHRQPVPDIYHGKKISHFLRLQFEMLCMIWRAWFYHSTTYFCGRIPTDKGYRYYVDQVMKCCGLPEEAKSSIRNALTTVDKSDLHLLLEAASRALSRTTNQLGVILAPKIRCGVLRQLHLFQIQPQCYILTIALESGFLKTMVVEFKTEIPQERLELACRILSVKFAGKTLQQMCNADDQQFEDVSDLELGIIRILVPSIKKIVEDNLDETVFAEGQTNVLLQRVFQS